METKQTGGWNRVKAIMPWLLIGILFFIPVYSIGISFVVRSDAFNFSARSISDAEVRALWAFVASGLATGATVIGLLFTRSHSQRTLAFQEDMENRRLVAEKEVNDRSAVLQRESEARLALDTVVKGLDLIVLADGSYAPKARMAGALAALVHLGHPIIAMRTLSAAWDEDAVDAETACWLISQVFEGGSEHSKTEAAEILVRHAAKLTPNPELRSYYVWPQGIQERWPSELPIAVRHYLLNAVVEVVVSRDRSWWTGKAIWAMALIHEALQKDPDGDVRDNAVVLLRVFLNTVEDGYSVGWGNEWKYTAHMRQDAMNYGSTTQVTSLGKQAAEKLEAWAQH